MGVELIERGIAKKTYEDLCNDMRKTVWNQYLHFTKDFDIKPCHNYGSFFPPVFESPTKYIVPQPELVEIFKKLKE